MTRLYTIDISSERVISWMNVIRNFSEKQKFRILENFWESQIKSKAWLINEIKNQNLPIEKNIYIFGGWYGILAQLLLDTFPKIKTVYSIDIDFDCKMYGNLLSNNDKRIVFITEDMKNFSSYNNPSLIINTSTEHITQKKYNEWLEKIPNNVPIIVQGNDFYECSEHVRCHDTLEEFNKNNKLTKTLYTDKLECMGPNGLFNRFMTIGYKK